MQHTVLVGTYTEIVHFGTGQIFSGKGRGIHAIRIDTDTWRYRLDSVLPTTNPSWVTEWPDHGRIYWCEETEEGRIKSAIIQNGTMVTTFIPDTVERPTKGANPCHVFVLPLHFLLITCNYSGGNITISHLREDGSIGEVCQTIAFTGRGPHPQRQEQSHPHTVNANPQGTHLIVCDLGLDTLHCFAIADIVQEFAVPSHDVSLPPGSGPRMCVFNDQGSMCYVVCELSNTIEVFRCDDRGVPEHHIQSIGTVPSGVKESSAAHVQLVVDDTILAVSNRGHDSITFFRVRSDGKLFHLYAHPCSGATPRAFFLADDASWMAISYQDSDLVEICDVELDILKVTTRMLIPIGSPVSLVCL